MFENLGLDASMGLLNRLDLNCVQRKGLYFRCQVNFIEINETLCL